MGKESVRGLIGDQEGGAEHDLFRNSQAVLVEAAVSQVVDSRRKVTRQNLGGGVIFLASGRPTPLESP